VEEEEVVFLREHVEFAVRAVFDVFGTGTSHAYESCSCLMPHSSISIFGETRHIKVSLTCELNAPFQHLDDYLASGHGTCAVHFEAGVGVGHVEADIAGVFVFLFQAVEF